MSDFKPIKFRSAHGYDTKKASDEAVLPVDEIGKSLTIQSMAEDADINVLMRRYGITGKMPENPRVPMYGDFTNVRDFQSALNALSEAQDGFMALPADVRARFQNDPQQLLEFLDKPDNVDEAIKLGLLNEAAVKNREDWHKKNQADKHAELLAAARAAGVKFVEESAPAKPGAGEPAPS